MPKIWFHSTRLLTSFRMIPHMPIVLSKTKFRFLGLYKGSIRGHIGGQEGRTAQNMVPFNSPTHKLSNDTPHAYSFTENQNFNFWVRSRLRLILEARWYFQWAYPCSWWFYYCRITTVPSHFVTALLI